MKVFPKDKMKQNKTKSVPMIYDSFHSHKQTVNFHHSMKKPCAYQKHMRSPEHKRTHLMILCVRKTSFFLGSLQLAGTWFLKIYNNSSASARNFIQCGTEYLAGPRRKPGTDSVAVLGSPKGSRLLAVKTEKKKNDRFFVELQGMIPKEMIQHRNSNQLKQS